MNSVSADIENLATGKRRSNQWLVIGASSLGTVFEWYELLPLRIAG